jgi:hypothetical protein
MGIYAKILEELIFSLLNNTIIALELVGANNQNIPIFLTLQNK